MHTLPHFLSSQHPLTAPLTHPYPSAYTQPPPISYSYLLPEQSELCDNNGWCTYQALDSLSIIVLYCVMVGTVALAILAIRNLIKLINIIKTSNKKYLFSLSYLRVYYIVLAWIICTLIITSRCHNKNLNKYYCILCIHVKKLIIILKTYKIFTSGYILRDI